MAALLLVASTTACTPGIVACPAVGYSTTVHVTLEEPRPGLSLVVCADSGCDRDAADGMVRVVGASESGWSVDWLSGDELAYVVVDEANSVVAEGRAPLEWERVGGSAECGGPQVAALTIEA